MGHSYRELYPEEAAASDQLHARHQRLARQLENLPFSRFKVADFPALARFWGLGSAPATAADLDRLERRLKARP